MTPRETVLNALDFDFDSANALPAINACVARARQSDGQVRVRIPPGIHHLWPEAAQQRELYVSNTVGAREEYRIKRIAILIEDMSDLVIDGRGAQFILHGEQSLFAIINSRNIELKGFDTDWVTPRVIDLTVLATDATTTDLYVPEGYGLQIDGTRLTWTSEQDPNGEPYWRYEAAQLPPDPRDTDLNDFYLQSTLLRTGRSFRTTWTSPTDPLLGGLISAAWIDNRILRLSYDHRASFPEVGEVFQFRSQPRDTPGGLIWNSRNTVIRDLTIGYLHGFGIIAQMTNGVTLSGLTFRAPVGTWRTTAGFADLIQVSGDRGQVLIENCSLGFAHDDGINVHGTYVELVESSGNRATFRYMQFDALGFPQFYPGDEVVLVERSTLRDVTGWRGRVVDVVGPTGKDRSHDLESMEVTFDRPLPAEAVPGLHVAENVTYAPDVTVRGCRFESIPTRGILMTTRGTALIEDCSFDQMEMASIYVSADSQYWYESGAVRDLCIRGNEFLRPGLDSPHPQPVLWFNPVASDLTGGHVHSGVRVEGNRFFMTGTTMLGAVALHDAVIADNVVAPYLPDGEGFPLMALEHCSAINVRHNRVAQGLTTDVTGGAAASGTTRFSWQEPSLHMECELPEMPPQGGVVLVSSALDTVRFSFATSTKAHLDVRINGETVDLDDAHINMPIHAGINVLECWVHEADARRCFRWALLALSPAQLTALGQREVANLRS